MPKDVKDILVATINEKPHDVKEAVAAVLKQKIAEHFKSKTGKK